MIVHRAGAIVCVTYRQRSVSAVVMLASENGKALMLGFDAMLGGYVGLMPVCWDEKEGVFRGLCCGEPVEVKP